MTLGWLTTNRSRRGARLALDDGRRRLTHAQLAVAVDRLAATLAEVVHPGRVVALSADADVDGVVALLAALRCGATAAPLNTRLTRHELRAYRARVRPALTLVAPAPGHAARDAGGAVVELGADTVRALASVTPDDTGPVAPPGAVVAFPTGGTTGLPKAACWSGDRLDRAVASSVAELDVGAGDVELYASPLCHVTVVPGFLATLAAGGCVLLQPRFDAEPAAARLRAGDVTRLFGTPTAVGRVLDHLDGPRPGYRLRLTYGAARSGARFVERLRDLLPDALLYSGYGATEVGAVARLRPEHRHGGPDGVGRPVAGATIRPVDGDGNPVAVGERGELAVASPWRMLGYLGAEGPAPELPDSSIRTGDVGRVDDRGFVHLDGRAKEMIVTGGENVFPAEVEAALLAHPLVADAAVFGAPDQEWGEQVRAEVVMAGEGAGAPPAEVEAALLAHCRERLAGYKLPKVLGVVDALPYTGAGKLDRAALVRRAGRC